MVGGHIAWDTGPTHPQLGWGSNEAQAVQDWAWVITTIQVSLCPCHSQVC